MQVETAVVGAFQVNCYILRNDIRHALVIDPGDEADRIAEILEARRLTVDGFLLTHGHCDHVSAIGALAQRFPAPVWLHDADMPWAFSNRNEMPPFYCAPAAPGDLRSLGPGRPDGVENWRWTVLETPGHTGGSVCLRFDDGDLLFTGDTLFAGSVGRTDLPAGDPRALALSLRSLAVLPDILRVLPGHGPESTIGREKRANMFMQNASVLE